MKCEHCKKRVCILTCKYCQHQFCSYCIQLCDHGCDDTVKREEYSNRLKMILGTQDKKHNYKQ